MREVGESCFWRTALFTFAINKLRRCGEGRCTHWRYSSVGWGLTLLGLLHTLVLERDGDVGWCAGSVVVRVGPFALAAPVAITCSRVHVHRVFHIAYTTGYSVVRPSSRRVLAPYLRSTLQLLRRTASADPDDITRAHAQLAVEELDLIVYQVFGLKRMPT